MANSVEQEYEWLVIFLVYNNSFYDEEHQDTEDYYTMEEQTKYILSQTRHIRFSNKVKIVFVEAEIKNKNARDKKADPVATISMLSKKKSGTWLSAVDDVWRRNASIEILTEVKNISLVLQKLRKDFNAKKNIIITAGHGTIVGINYYLTNMRQKAKSSTVIKGIAQEEIDFSKKLPTQSLSALTNTEKLLFLYNQEINEVLKNVFTDKKVDVLVMYNCLMQNIFTQFEFRETVDWLVAPLSGISVPGFDYMNVLSEINLHPEITGEVVSELFINSIRAGNGYSFFRKDIEGSWKVAATKINKEVYELIQKQFEELFAEINNISNSADGLYLIYCINTVIRHLFSYSFYCLKDVNVSDIGVFLELLKERIELYYPDFKIIFPKINALQDALALRSDQYVFEGDSFYYNDSDYSYAEQEDKYKAKISNLGILLPTSPLPLGPLDDIVNTSITSWREGEEKYKTPSFLLSNNYAEVIKKLLASSV